MNKEQYAIWTEMMELIAKYDWAVENMTDPYDTGLTREAAVKIRNSLVKQAGELTR